MPAFNTTLACFSTNYYCLDRELLKFILKVTMSDVPQTDVSRRAALPTASLLPRSSQPTIDQSSDEYLDAIEEEWNKKVDAEIDTLVDGMVDLVSLASVGVA